MPPEITHKRVLRVAIPILLSNETVPLLGAVDTAVIGNLGQAAPLGAVGLGAIILGTIYWAFGFLRMRTSGLAAQAQGARLPAVAGGCTSDRIDCLGIRRDLYRRYADARDAADDAVVAGGLCGDRADFAARFWQSWSLGRADGAEPGARPYARARLSGRCGQSR